MPLEPGRTIDRYTVLELLGEGGMAEVYRVRHEALHTQYALKLLTLTKQAIRDRLVTEGRVQARLDHPNAVTVHDVVEVDGAPALIMELVDGPDLEQWLTDTDPELELVEAVFRGIVAAVGEAHRLGILHRDLKPANVLMARRPDGTWQPKVADFGLAKLADQDSSLTRSGVPMGTPQYMAPEQIRDAKNVDERADVFSLGCILYRMVARRSAFSGTDLIAIFGAVMDGAWTRPETLRPEVPAHLIAAIEGCLEVETDRRIASCTALLEVLDGSARSARRPPSPRSQALQTRVWAALAVALLAVGAVAAVSVLVAVALLWGASEPEPEGPCGRGGSVVGYAQVPPRLLNPWRVGSTYRPSRDVEVRTAYPAEDNDWDRRTEVVCTIGGGSAIEVVEAPIRTGRYGTWIPIVPEAVEPKEEEEQ